MASKTDLQDWVLTALGELDGKAKLVDVARIIWRDHEHELRSSGDLFYTWQYDMRWASQALQDQGRLDKGGGFWTLRNL